MNAPELISEGLRLNLGAGPNALDGWENLDLKSGQEVYPLSYPDASVDAIRASHILEHFSHRQIGAVLDDWVRALKPGGLLQIAVPDFALIAQQYLAGADIPTQGYIMGSHADDDDHHGAIFDAEELGDVMRKAGLIGITRWHSKHDDSAGLDISLNLQGIKPPEKLPTCYGVLSLPRLAFTDNYFCAFEALPPLGIGLRKATGAYWDQCLERGIEETLEKENPEYILTLDYDSVFSRRDVQALLSAAVRHPHADAIAALQAHRNKSLPLLTKTGDDGKPVLSVPWEETQSELMRVHTAHFGLTLIRTESLREMPKPWFASMPDAEGKWGESRWDADIYFWKQWEKANKTLYVASRVPIGHAELMVRWPSRDLTATYQHPSDYWKDGKPEDIWR